MSHYKTTEQIEFAEMFAKLEGYDISADDVARRLKLSPQIVSMYRSGKRNPRPLTMDAMRAFVIEICGESPSEAGHFNDATTRSELDLWRQRALRAEKALADFKNALRNLLTAPPPQKINSGPLTEAQQILKNAGDEWDRENSPKT